MKLNLFQKNLHETALKLSLNFRKTESDLIEILMKIDKARVYLALGYSSLYTYAHEGLGLSEANSHAFTAVARKSKSVPELKAQISAGALSVSKAKRILSVITPANQTEWISKAVSLPKSELEREVVKANPESERRESLRIISKDRFSMKLGLSDELLKKLKRAQVLLMNKKRKNLNLEQTLEGLVDAFLKSEDPVVKAERILGPGTESAKTLVKKESQDRTVPKNPVDPIEGVPGFFHPRQLLGPKRNPIPATVKHQIQLRDQGQCQFGGSIETKDLASKKCGEMAYVEIHHKRAVSNGGPNTQENLITLCSKHHRFMHRIGG